MEANASVDMFSKVLENQLLQTTKLVEEHLDSEIQKLDQMDEDELERLKEKRLEALRKAQQQKQVEFSKIGCVCINIFIYIHVSGFEARRLHYIANNYLRNGFQKDMGNTEKSLVRETFFKKSRRVKKWFAISTETPHSGVKY
uniref:Thioredoxin domain containing 9 n=1 Tax=Ailuropoda melanoleuca TaxID=9646 RepID=A0A7N5K3X8_AILME